ncbi:MAG: ComEC/Rec2 family competence protein [Mesorhizobium sp.]
MDERAFVTLPPGAPLDAPTGLPAQADALSPAVMSGPAHRIQLYLSSIRWKRLPGVLEAAGELEVARGALFLCIPVLLIVGSLTYFSWPTEPTWALLAAWICGVSVLAWLVRRRRGFHLTALAALVILAGAAAAKFETQRSGAKMLGSEISTRLTGEVQLIEPRENGRVRLTLRVLETERPKLRYQPERVRVTARAVPAKLRPGDVVEGIVRLSPPMGPLRPGSYDFAFEAWFDGIGANGFFLRDPTLSTRQGEPGLSERIGYMLENARNVLADRIRSHIDGEAGEIAAALVAGVRAGIPEEANEALRITGLAHVLSISGLHFALVAGVVIFTMRAGFALFPAFASKYPARKYASAGSLVVLVAYLAISGMEVAAVRSFLMISVMLIALQFDQFALSMRNLAIAAIIIMLVAPHEAAGPSFQMSFAATGALIAAYAWWAQRDGARTDMTRQRRSWAMSAARGGLFVALGLVATSLLAGAATGIYGAWHFQRASPLGLLANLGAMPAVSAIVMPAAVFGVLLMPFGIEGPVFWLMGLGIDWMMAVARYLAARTPVDAIGAIPISAVILLSIALIPLTMATTRPWRWAALPFLFLGLFSLTVRQLPQIYVSEDAKLVGVRTGSGDMAVNRNRPNMFRAQDWQRAMYAENIVRPEKAADDLAQQAGSERFACHDGLCTIAPVPGAAIVHATTMQVAARACDWAALIVIEDPTAANPCPFSKTMVITAKRLALEGSAEARVDASGAELWTAVGNKKRPWNDHRRFSRAARGLGPYQRQPRPEQGGKAQEAESKQGTVDTVKATRQPDGAPPQHQPAATQ